MALQGLGKAPLISAWSFRRGRVGSGFVALRPEIRSPRNEKEPFSDWWIEHPDVGAIVIELHLG